MTMNHQNLDYDFPTSSEIPAKCDHKHDLFISSKQKQVNNVKYIVQIADGIFSGFTRIIEMDIGIFDCILNSKEVFKILNNYICNHMYFKLLSFLSEEKLRNQMCELNAIKNAMTIDETLCTSESDTEFIHTKKLLIYIKN
jgi:hypothetical protein